MTRSLKKSFSMFENCDFLYNGEIVLFSKTSLPKNDQLTFNIHGLKEYDTIYPFQANLNV